jgi:K+-sensing histidine kinase KdpD
LSIAERVRSSLQLEDVLVQTLDELGQATGASRSLIQLEPDATGVSRMLEWDRGDTSPLNVMPPTPVARRVFVEGEPLVIDDASQLDDEELTSYLAGVGSRSVIAWPIRWQERVIAVIGFQDSTPREWRADALPLLQRLEGQIGAALVQAELFEQQQRAIHQLEELTRMREELVANVSHEFRTPLTAIIGVVKTLRRNDLELTPEARDEMLAVLEQQSERLHVLAEDLLDLARFRRGAHQLRRRRVSFSELVASALQGIVVPEDREVAVRIEEDAVLNVDPARMSQVLSNLVMNAVRHGAGEISVRCSVEEGDAVVLVSDEGGGVRDDFAEEMFEVFSHDGGRSDSTGLGLPIARAIVEAHGGSLDYVSPADGAHQFVVTLPATN